MAILFGLLPEVRRGRVASTPGGVLGGITVVLYGMIGLLGAKIWKENGVDFANPVNLVPLAAGIIIAIGNTSLKFTDNFSLSGIALGTHRRARRLPPGPGRSRRPQLRDDGHADGGRAQPGCTPRSRTDTAGARPGHRRP